MPQDGLYEANDYKKYFTEASRKAYLIKVNDRHLSKFAYREEFKGNTERRTAAYTEVREDSSTRSTHKLPLEVEFGKMSNEIAGFVLLNKVGTTDKLDWNMAKFFIIARFQNKGIGKRVAQQIWQMHQGLWEVSAIPENKPAIIFWRNVIKRVY